MKPKPLPGLALALAAVFAAAPAQAKADDVSVKLAPFAVDRKTIDFTQKAQANVEEGLTQWFFHCVPQLNIVADKGKKIPGGYAVSIVIHKVSILVSISVAVYLPDHASAALIAHEQGHVQICKSVYAESAQAAQACAQELLQRPFTGSSQTQIGATEQATELARKWFCRRFMAATEDRIQKLSLKYDALTDHGRSSVLPAQAVTAVLGGAPAQK